MTRCRMCDPTNGPAHNIEDCPKRITIDDRNPADIAALDQAYKAFADAAKPIGGFYLELLRQGISVEPATLITCELIRATFTTNPNPDA